MGENSKIQWTSATWNPIAGCSVVSPGCTNCYAMKEAGSRLAQTPKYRSLTIDSKAGPVWTGEVREWPSALNQPLRWSKPRMIFVNSMSDLFHENVPDEWIDRIFAVMALCPQHKFQVLTKRGDRMRDYMAAEGLYQRILRAAEPIRRERPALGGIGISDPRDSAFWRQLWLGVSVEDQTRADERIPLLLETPAAVRWVSAEPLLGELELRLVRYDENYCGSVLHGFPTKAGSRKINWVVVGGESGHNARPFDLQWARNIIFQCRSAGVPVFMKQLGSRPYESEVEWVENIAAAVSSRDIRLRHRKGGNIEEWPVDLRIREFPHQQGVSENG